MLHLNIGPKFGEPENPLDVYKGLDPERRLLTNCCVCRMPVRELVVVRRNQEWYGPEALFECAPGFGCDADQRRTIGAGNRWQTIDAWGYSVVHTPEEWS